MKVVGRVDVVILRLLVQGKTQIVIANRLNVSQSAISQRIKKLRRRLGAYKVRLNRLKVEREVRELYTDADDIHFAEARVRAWHEWFVSEIVPYV